MGEDATNVKIYLIGWEVPHTTRDTSCHPGINSCVFCCNIVAIALYDNKYFITFPIIFWSCASMFLCLSGYGQIFHMVRQFRRDLLREQVFSRLHCYTGLIDDQPLLWWSWTVTWAMWILCLLMPCQGPISLTIFPSQFKFDENFI